MNNERREAIEQYVDKVEGKWIGLEHSVVSIPYMGGYAEVNYVLFLEVARELGWCNGYKWGVEYPTNGKKPDLPGDIRVSYSSKMVFGASRADIVDWGKADRFRVTDERYKPKEITPPIHENHRCVQVEIKDNWHERGELPPVGETCLAKVDSHHVRCTIIAYHEDLVWLLSHDYDRTPVRFSIECDFKPIQSHRDKVVEAAAPVLKQEGLLGLYDAGMLKLPEGDSDE